MLLEQMIVLFLLMGVGFLCYKKSLITDEVSKKLSSVVVNVANPALVLTACMGEEKIRGEELLTTVVIMSVMYPALLLLGVVLPRVLRVERYDGVFQYRVYGISGDYRIIWKWSAPLCNALYHYL